MPHLSVVIPVYNEEAISPRPLPTCRRGWISAASTTRSSSPRTARRTRTPALLERLTKGNPRLQWFHSETPNYGVALKAGILRRAGELRGVRRDRPVRPRASTTPRCRCSSAARPTWWWARRRRRAPPTGGRWCGGWPPGLHNKLLRRDAGLQGHRHPRAEGLPPRRRSCRSSSAAWWTWTCSPASSWCAPGATGLRVVEIPIQLHEKRQPSIHLFRRVPNVLKNVAKLVYVIRVAGSRGLPMRLAALSVDLDSLKHYCRIHGAGRVVALDAGGRAGGDEVALPRLLELFDAAGAKATFFAIGEDLASPTLARALALAARGRARGGEPQPRARLRDVAAGRRRSIDADLERAHRAIERGHRGARRWASARRATRSRPRCCRRWCGGATATTRRPFPPRRTTRRRLW